MPPKDEDWAAAVRASSTAELQKLIAGATIQPTAAKVQEAFVVACGANATGALTLLLDWGAPVGSKDLTGRLSLHAAAEAGAAGACALLCSRGADPEQKDDQARTATSLAIARGHLPAVKELLRAGAAVPENASAPGLMQVVKEVAMEKQIEGFKAKAQQQPEVTLDQLAEVDAGVWQCQREHMRLLGLREEQRAGAQLASYQERTTTELAAAERSRVEGGAKAATISALRVEILDKQTKRNQLTQDLNALDVTEKAVTAEDDKLKGELEVRRTELERLHADIEARDAAAESEQAAIDATTARSQSLAEEVRERQGVNAGLRAALAQAQEELDGWRRDREAAARLTAEAHKLLGN